jgi:hypothetical protein
MDGGGWLARIRWRHRGAWMWPLFVPLTIVDGVIGHALPPVGDGWNLIGAVLFGGFLNLTAIVALSVPLRAGLSYLRPDLPRMVAGNYAGLSTMCALTVGLLVVGIANNAPIQTDQRAMADAIKRAQAYIGGHAPTAFEGNVEHISTFTIQGGSIYRMCVPNLAATHDYCVIVHERQPFAQSVRPDGSESNAILDAGAN